MLRMTLLLIPLTVGGCSQPELQSSATSDLPSERALAAARAYNSDEPSTPTLVGLLESADPAVRMLAIRALEQRTGETYGFHYADPPTQRALAVERWVERVRSSVQGAANGPGPR